MKRLLVALAVPVVVVVAVVAPALAEGGSNAALKVRTTNDAWYSTSALCTAPVGCGSSATTTSYPDNTLHVGLTLNSEVARAYIAFGPNALPLQTTARDGSLTLPVATDAGSEAPDTAQLVVCLVPGGLTMPAPATAPAVDCAVQSPAVYLQGAIPAFTADLAPFIAKRHGDLNGLALAVLPKPSPQSAAIASSWHVAISGHARTTAGAHTVFAQVDLDGATAPDESIDIPSQPLTPEVAPPTAPLPGLVAPETPLVTPPAAVVPDVPVVAAPHVASPVTVPLRRAVYTVKGGQYGLVWAVPALLFLLGWVLVSSTNRDLRSYARSR